MSANLGPLDAAGAPWHCGGMSPQGDERCPPLPDEGLGLSTFLEIAEWLLGSHFRRQIQMCHRGGRWPGGIPSCMMTAKVLVYGLNQETSENESFEGKRLWSKRFEALRDGTQVVPEDTAGLLAKNLGLSAEWLEFLKQKADWWRRGSPSARSQEGSPRRYRKDVVQKAIEATLGALQASASERGGAELLPKVKHPDLLDALTGVQKLTTYYRQVFGGRSNELAALDRFLDDDSAGYLLIRERAGRGKTALLVHWVESLASRSSDWSVAFVPVSRVFETDSARAALGLWAGQLAAFHGGSLEGEVLSADALRARVNSLLRATVPVGRKLLIVLDGVDEASDWSLSKNLFPVPPPDSVKIVVGVREVAHENESDTIRGLGWLPEQTSRLRLPLLDQPSIEDALTHAGYESESPQLATLAVKQVLRISAGEPVLVRLLARDLVRGDATPDELRFHRQGLDEYLAQFLKDIDAQAEVSDDAYYLLGLCSAAVGPLSLEDCAALRAADSDDAGPRKPWRGVDVRKAAGACERFLIGNGEGQRGYAFQLTVFQERYSERLTTAERERFEAAFSEWGRSSWDEREAFPAYLRKHLIEHLARSQKWAFVQDVLLQSETTGPGLVHPWARMCARHEGSYAGYLSDVKILQDHAVTSSDLLTFFHCALITGLISDIYRSFPAELLLALVEIGTPQGLWTVETALDVVEVMDLGLQTRALTLLVPHFPEDRKSELLKRTEKAASSAGTLAELVPAVPKADQARLARKALHKVLAW